MKQRQVKAAIHEETTGHAQLVNRVHTATIIQNQLLALSENSHFTVVETAQTVLSLN